MKETQFWKMAWKLLAAKCGLGPEVSLAEVPKGFGDVLVSKMLELINGRNYCILALMLHDRSSLKEDELMDLLFYHTIRNRQVYRLFREAPDEYGKSLISQSRTSHSLHLREFVSPEDYAMLKEALKVGELCRTIVEIPLDEVKEMFPKTYKNFKRRGFL